MSTRVLSEAQILDEIRLTKIKLQGMKDHLEVLLRKKIRLESEILILRKAIKNKEKNFALKVKAGVQLESSGPLVLFESAGDDYQIGVPQDYPKEIFQALQELCLTSREVHDLIQSYTELQEDHQ